jgi:hypothetical protein
MSRLTIIRFSCTGQKSASDTEVPTNCYFLLKTVLRTSTIRDNDHFKVVSKFYDCFYVFVAFGPNNHVLHQLTRTTFSSTHWYPFKQFLNILLQKMHFFHCMTVRMKQAHHAIVGELTKTFFCLSRK